MSEKNQEKCVRAAHTMLSILKGTDEAMPAELPGLVKMLLETGLWRGENPVLMRDAQERLPALAARIMAASLGMKVHYPAMPARDDLPATVAHTKDWSKSNL